MDEFGILKIADFKFSKLIPDESEPFPSCLLADTCDVGDVTTISNNHEPLNFFNVLEARGPVHFLSPEQLQSEGVPSFSSDMWAVGCLFFELVFGMHPFDQTAREPISAATVSANPFAAIVDPVPVSSTTDTNVLSRDFCDLMTLRPMSLYNTLPAHVLALCERIVSSSPLAAPICEGRCRESSELRDLVAGLLEKRPDYRPTWCASFFKLHTYS